MLVENLHYPGARLAFEAAGARVIGVPNHAEASAWMKVLKDFGFSTQHEH